MRREGVEQPAGKRTTIPADTVDPRDRELLEGLKVAGIAVGVACLAGLLSASGGVLI